MATHFEKMYTTCLDNIKKLEIKISKDEKELAQLKEALKRANKTADHANNSDQEERKEDDADEVYRGHDDSDDDFEDVRSIDGAEPIADSDIPATAKMDESLEEEQT